MPRFRKIVLIEPRAPRPHVFSRVALPRLGLPLLSAILRQQGYQDIRIYVEDLAPVDLAEAASADLVGISTITGTSLRAYRLGSDIKRLNPRCTVVMGGAHVTFRPQEPFDSAFLNQYGIEQPVCDYVVCGEGDSLIVDLVRALESGERPEPILGARQPSADGRRGKPTGLTPDLDCLPFPDLNSIVGRKRMHIAPVATSRGCPFDCYFCSVIEMFGQRMRYRSVEIDDPTSVIAEIRAMRHHEARSIFFYDDNFTANINRTKRLLENLIRANLIPRSWTAQARATEVVRDRELLQLMRRTNCVMLYLGLESVNQETLKEFNKKQDVAQVIAAIRVLREYGIRTHGMFVVGADTDTVETIRETAAFAIAHNISTVQFMILTPLPGTRQYDRLDEEGRIFDRDWSRYDAHHTVFWPARMSPYELQTETFRAMQRVYPWRRAISAALAGNLMTSVLRGYGHRLIQRHLRQEADYVRALPRRVWTGAMSLDRAISAQPR